MSKYPPGPRSRSTGGNFESLIATSNTGATMSWSRQVNLLEQVNDIVVPGARAILESGGIINNPFSCSKTLSSYDSGSYSGSKPGSFFSWTNYPFFREIIASTTFLNGDDRNYDSIPQFVLDRATSLAKQAALAALDPTDFQFGEDLFEVHKTYQTLRDPLGSARDVHNKLEKSLKTLVAERSVAKAIGKSIVGVEAAIGQAMLATKYNYGSVLHTAANVYSKTKYFDRINRINKHISRLKRAKGKSAFANAGTSEHKRKGTTATITVKNDFSYSGEVRCGILYKVGPEKRYNSVGKDWGLRLKDLPRAAWAVMPMTWFSDRFYDIGSGITGAMNILDPRVRIVTAWVVIEYRTSSRQYVVSMTDPSWVFSFSGGYLTTAESTTRGVWVPQFSDTRPVLDLQPLKKTKNVLDALALGATRVNSLVNPPRYKLHFN